jgi:hypothetical protein
MPKPKPTKPKATTPTYALHPGFKMLEAGERNIVERTGKSIDEWAEIAKQHGPAGEKARAAWLAEVHGISPNYAKWIAERAAGGRDDYDPEAFVEQQYAGKDALRPLYDRLLSLGVSLGDDVTVTPCATFVPLRRKYVFAQIKPSTRTRIDLGLALGATKGTTRLEETGGFAKGDRITHRIAISSAGDIDAEVTKWLQAAYDRGNDSGAKPKPVVAAGDLPADFKKALAASPRATATFETLTPRMKSDWAGWITEAKKEETRAMRLKTAIERLAAGKKTAY